MARPGITYLDVAKTAIKLVEQKIYPSIEEIRKALGTGSNSTINKHLREWRSKHGYQAELEQGLPDSLLLAVKGIYDGIKEEATNKMNILEGESKIAVAELKTRTVELETEHAKFLQANKTLENTVNEHKEENLALQRKLSVLEQSFSKKTDENNALQARLEDKNSEIVTLKQQLKNVQDNLDHYRETVKQARDAENNLLNEKAQSLERQLYQQQLATSKATEETATLLRQIKAFEKSQQETARDLNKALMDRQEQEHIMQRQNLINNELTEKCNNVLADNIQITNELKAEKEATIRLKMDLEKVQERNFILNNALEKAETKMVVIGDKNLFLTQEKTELAFQLRQLQSCRQ